MLTPMIRKQNPLRLRRTWKRLPKKMTSSFLNTLMGDLKMIAACSPALATFYRREWKEARNNFDYIINSMPKSGSSRIPEAQIWMAMSYYQEGQIELAADYLQAAYF